MSNEVLTSGLRDQQEVCMLEVSSYPRFLPVWRSDWSDGAISVGGRTRLVRAEGCGGLELSSRPGIHDIRPTTLQTPAPTNMITKHQDTLGWMAWCCLLVAVSAQYDYVSECPAENGFFADALQCDRYYECQDGEVRLPQSVPASPLTSHLSGLRAFLPGRSRV